MVSGLVSGGLELVKDRLYPLVVIAFAPNGMLDLIATPDTRRGRAEQRCKASGNPSSIILS